MIRVAILVALSLSICLAFKSTGRGTTGLCKLFMSASTVQRPKSPKSYRIFNSASLPELLNPISEKEAENLIKVNDVLKKAGLTSEKNDDDLLSMSGPDAGNADTLANKLVDGMVKQSSPSIGGQNGDSSNPKEPSFVVWAEITDVIEEGIVLMNHWAQRAILITSYEPGVGAKGYELNDLTLAAPGEVVPAARADFTYTWPPLALELELVDKKWQPTRVSLNIKNQEIFQFLPPEIKKTQAIAWELIFLLLLSADESDDKDVIQALMDTGISPRKGLIAYMRLFERVSERTNILSEVPEYRRIQSVDREFEV